jgi:hypothetical protein
MKREMIPATVPSLKKEKLYDLAHKKFGHKKGVISLALEEMVDNWIYEEESKWASGFYEENPDQLKNNR